MPHAIHPALEEKVHLRFRLSERTFADYSEVLKRYVRPKLGSKRLSQLQPLEIACDTSRVALTLANPALQKMSALTTCPSRKCRPTNPAPKICH